MENLIYYPTFEPQSENWLKYALIYLENFSPIIPVRGNSQLSDLFKQIITNTELVRSIQPTSNQGDRATTKAIKEIELIKEAPERYFFLFNEPNIIQVWSDHRRWNSNLYSEKFNFAFEEYCVNNNFGQPSNVGLRLSEELAGFYMTYLAEEMAFEGRLTPITDVPELDGISSFLRTTNVRQVDEISASQAVIDLHLPRDIESIKIQKFIDFRNDTGISELRASYNSTLEDFYSSVERDFDPHTWRPLMG